MVFAPQLKRNHHLPQVAHTSDALGASFGPAERRQQQSGENRDDGDDDEKLDERKPVFPRVR